MIKELVVNEVEVRIWQNQLPAPALHHPIRAQRLHPHRQAEFDVIAALIPHPWSWDDIVKDPLGKPHLKNGYPPKSLFTSFMAMELILAMTSLPCPFKNLTTRFL